MQFSNQPNACVKHQQLWGPVIVQVKPTCMARSTGQTFSIRSTEPYVKRAVCSLLVLVILQLNAQCYFHTHFRHTLGQASSAART